VNWAPVHFAEMEGDDVALGLLISATNEWGLDPYVVIEALAGSSPASSSAARSFDPSEYAWRCFNSDLCEPTLAERPELLATLAARLGPPVLPVAGDLRGQVPAACQSEFDSLWADAQLRYGCRDDNTVACFSWPLGLIRRAVLEVGLRTRLDDPEDALEATPAELQALLSGGGPATAELHRRAAARIAAASYTPPGRIGEPVPFPPHAGLPPNAARLEDFVNAYRAIAWMPRGRPTTVGSSPHRGRAVVSTTGVDAISRLQPGDVLVALTTTAPFNTVFPIAGAVAVQEGGVMSHAAVLARELGTTAVIGVPGLLDAVHDGDLVEVDPVRGVVRVISA
jgi:phosphohistidine swiveling domain-containing protein